MALVKPYHKYRGVESFSATDLLAVAAEQLPAVAPIQTRYRVERFPTARSLRFYTARGLVDKPRRPAGGVPRYGYRHLLQLLVVKFLQSQYIPLVKAGSLMAGASNRDLEHLLPDAGGAGARALLRGAVVPPAAAGGDEPGRAGVPGEEAAAREADTWHRVEISPGIELHVHAAALPGAERERLRSVLLREMGRIRGWADGSGTNETPPGRTAEAGFTGGSATDPRPRTSAGPG